MKITTAMIAWKLNWELDFAKPVSFPLERRISRVGILDEKAIRSDGLYLVLGGYDQIAEVKRSGASFLTLGGNNAGRLKEENVCCLSEPLPGLDWNQTTLQVLQTVAQFLLDLSCLEREVVSLKSKNTDISGYLPLLEQIFPGEFLVQDNNLELLAGSTEWARSHFGVLGETGDREQFTELMFTAEYQANCRRRDFFELRPGKDSERYLCRNFFREEDYLGCMVVSEREAGAADGDGLAMLQLCFRILEPIVLDAVDQNHALSRNVQIHELLYRTLTEGEDSGGADWARILKPYGWNEQDRCCAIDLCFFEGISAVNTGDYVCNLLEMQWGHSFAVTVNEHILWIINCSKHKISESSDAFQKLILNTVSSYICRAGVSDFFTGFDSVMVYVRQARMALELGQKKASHRWYHLFRDYVLDFILDAATREYTPEQLCHKGLLRLRSYDQTHGTGYMESLKTYYRSEKNVSLAAEQLFLHRTSLVRQLNRMETIMGIRLDDSYEQDLYLQLSLILLEKE